jgi:hypothetical protein
LSKNEVVISLYYPDGEPAGRAVFDGSSTIVYDRDGKLLFVVEGPFPPRPRKANYDWIDKVLNRGLEDGRKRFILYVASRYLVNVKGLSEDKAVEALSEFAKKKGSGKVYESWIRSVVRGVKAKKLMPWSLKRLEERDPELYKVVKKALEESTS